MKTIGLVGGMSWESSAVYYRDLNLGVRERLGGLASPKLVMSTVDFAELTELEDAVRVCAGTAAVHPRWLSDSFSSTSAEVRHRSSRRYSSSGAD